jgi:hypothetical protein
MSTSLYRPGGIYSAQWLPTDAAGRLDRPALAAHLAFERNAGVTGVLALGSTGEFPHFSPGERKQALAVFEAGLLQPPARGAELRRTLSVPLVEALRASTRPGE